MSELKNRNQILPEDKWSVEDLFSSDEAWQKLYDDIENSLSGFDKFKPLTMANLYECLNFRDEVYLNTERVYVYAGLRANEDSDNSFYQAMDSKAARLSSLVQAASAFIDSSIALLPEDEILKAVETEPLKLYAHYLKDILRSKEHILTQDKEEILAQMQEVAGVPSNVFYMLNNADMTFPDVVDSNGESHKLTHGTFISYLESSDRVLRKSAFNALYDTYKKQLNTITASYSGSVKVDSFGAKVRKYGSSLEAHLEPNNIPTGVYTQLIDTVNKNLNLMHRYISIRKKALGLDDLNMYDLYTPIVKDIDTKKTYEEAVGNRWAMQKPMPESMKQMILFDATADVDKIAGMVDFVFCAVDMKKDEIRALEERYAKAECPVVSNNSAHRFTPDVPMVVPEVNPEHIEVIESQRKRLGTKRGFIAVKSNCSIQSYVPALSPLRKYGIQNVLACTYQAISGAGKTFERWPEILDNIVPYIGGEEEKSEKEPLKVWGKIENGQIVSADSPLITTQCLRVPVSDGHTAAVFVSFEQKPSKEEILKIWEDFKGVPQELELPSAPKQFIHYFQEDDRPQAKLDRNIEGGMAVSVGRLREDTMFDYKFVCLSHNTLRGAAGGGVLLAELLAAKGYMD